MKVSVCIIARNAEKTIEHCLNAVFNQSLAPSEVIVVNDASADATKTIAESFDVQLIDLKKNLGTGKARSIAAIAAGNEIIAFTDSDCIPDTDWLKQLVEPFKHEEVGVAHGYTFTDKDDSIFFHFNKAFSQGIVQTSNAAFRKKALHGINFFDENFSLIREDTDAVLRINALGYETIFAQKAKVFHPSKPREFAHIVLGQKRYENDALYYKKHPEHFKTHELSQKFFPHSQIFRAWVVVFALMASIILLAIKPVYAFIALFSAYLLACLFGLMLAAKEKHNTSTKNILFLIFLNPMIFISTSYYLFKGMIKHKKMIL